MSEEIKYCKFCGEQKTIKEFCKSGFAIKNKCKQCANKETYEKRRNVKRVEKLESVLDEIREIINKNMSSYYDFTKAFYEIENILDKVKE